jgi:DNA-binding MarR family transcriptional regulator
VDALYTQFDAVFFEKTRLSIMTVLYREDESSFSRLKQLFGLTDGAAYSHLRKLVESGYVEQSRRLGTDRAETWYALSKMGRETFRGYLEFLVSVTDNGSGRVAT